MSNPQTRSAVCTRRRPFVVRLKLVLVTADNGKGVNLLPQALENVICRIDRKRGVAFSSIPVH